MNEPVPEQPGADDDVELQFDHSERTDTDAAPGRLTCAACAAPIHDVYYEVDGNVACAPCHDAAGQFVQGGRAGRAVRAVFGAAVGALVGALIYFGVAQLSGYEIGLIAILVGWLVGAGVRWGSGGRGGWPYQILAVLVTYFAIGAAYTALVFADMRAHPEDYEPMFEEPGTGAVTSDARPSEDEDFTAAETALGIAAVLVAATAMIAILPIAVNINAPIGFLIVGFGLYQAWATNRRVVPTRAGPFRVGDASAAAAPPPPPAETGDD
jgi:hypothetical protein